MSEIDRFLWPWALGLVVLVPLVWAVRWWGRRGADSSIVYSGSADLMAGPRGLRAGLVWVPGVVRGAALVLCIVGLARPQKVIGRTRTTTEGIAIQMVIDRSGSMEQSMDTRPNSPNRLEVVKEVAAAFIEGDGKSLKGRGADLIGMVAFARYADTVSPLVREHGALVELLEKIESARGQRSEDGTAIGDAVALAAARLKRAEEEVRQAALAQGERTEGAGDAGGAGASDGAKAIKGKAIVLLTDGEDRTSEIRPLEAAAIAKEFGVRLYAIGVGGGAGRAADVGGLRVALGSPIDVTLLRQMAEMTGGRAWVANSAEDLLEVYEAIDRLEPTTIEVSRTTRTQERYRPFVAAAFGLLGVEALLGALVFRRAA